MANPKSDQGGLDRFSLRRLTLTDNFESKAVDVTIAANTEEAIRNPFRDTVPTGYLIVSHEGNGIIRKGDADWTADFLYLKNISSTSSATIKVIFLRV